MALPSPKFYTTGDVEITAVQDFGSVEAGAYKPDETGTIYRLYNDKDEAGSEDMTSVKVTIRGSCGETSKVWVEQHWVQVKSDGVGSTGIVDDAQTVFTAVGKNKELSLGDIPSGEYRTLYVRCHPPTDAEQQDLAFQFRVTYQNPQTSICNWITGLRGNGVVASTGDPFAMSTTGATDPIPYQGGYALINNNEIYYGSSGTYNIVTASSGTYNIYLNESGAFGETTGSVAANQLNLYEATISSGVCTHLDDKRVYLSGVQSGTTGAMSTLNPDLGDIYLDVTNGRLYAAETAGTYSLIDFSDYTDSAMIITGGEIDVGSCGGTFKVAALTSILRETSGATATLKYQTLTEQDNQAITEADTTYYVRLTYSSGISISETVANGNNVIGIGHVRKTTGDEVHFANSGRRLQDGVGKLHKRAASLREIKLANGCTLSYAGEDNLGIAAGVVYEGINRFTPFSTGAFTSSGTDTFTYVGQSTGEAGWLYTTGQTDIDYAHYDDGSTGLKEILPNQYGCHWVYMHPDDEHIYVVYGRGTYKLAEAEVAEAPNVPEIINDLGLLLGCIITPQLGKEFTTVQMVTDTFFTGTAVATHNDLGGLDSGEYQHLTSAEHDEVTPWLSSVTLLTGGTVNIPTGQEYQINDAEVKLDEWGTPSTGTALNSSTGRHGLLIALDGSTGNYLRGDGTWDTPPGATGAGVTTFLGLTDTPADYTDDGGKYVKVSTGEDALEFSTPPGGEANTASNVNTTGIGVYEGKVDIDLQFKGIRAGSPKVTVTDSTGTHTISIDLSGVVTSSGAFTVDYIPQISSTGGVIKASPFLVTTGDVFDFGAHSAGFTEQAIATTTGSAPIDWNSGLKALFTRSTGSAGAVTFSFTAPVKSANLMLTIRGSTAGSTGTVTWPAVKWDGGSAPSLGSGASAINVVSFYYSTGLTSYLGASSTGTFSS